MRDGFEVVEVVVYKTVFLVVALDLDFFVVERVVVVMVVVAGTADLGDVTLMYTNFGAGVVNGRSP